MYNHQAPYRLQAPRFSCADVRFQPSHLWLVFLSDSVLQVVLVHAGLTSLIAHIRVGRMQAALEAKSTVQPAVGRLYWFMSLSTSLHDYGNKHDEDRVTSKRT